MAAKGRNRPTRHRRRDGPHGPIPVASSAPHGAQHRKGKQIYGSCVLKAPAGRRTRLKASRRPVVGPSFVEGYMTKKALEAIAAGLRDALAISG